MKAVVNETFGSPDVLKMKEMELPSPKQDEILIKSFASSVNTIDIFFRSGKKAMFGLTRISTGIRHPKKTILGFDIAGEVVEIGSNVINFDIGDRVFGGAKSGAYAEFTIVSANKIAKIPESLSYYDAGVTPMAGLSALQGLNAGNIQHGQKILVYGASGGIGTFAVQLAKTYDAEVTGVASGKNEELVRGLGVDEFIDYQKEDFTTKVETKYDLIFDTVSKSPMSRWKRALTDDGIFVNAGSPSMSMVRFFTSQMGNSFRKKKYRSFNTQFNPKELEFIAQLLNEGKIKSVIDKTFSFEEINKAHEYYERGHTRGKVLIKIRDFE